MLTKMKYRRKDFLSFSKVSKHGVIPVAIDADSLIDTLSISVSIGNMKSGSGFRVFDRMMTPIVESFKNKS